jgi:hypothetical protein
MTAQAGAHIHGEAGEVVQRGTALERAIRMSDGFGGPDPAQPGFPQDPERSGPHLVIDHRRFRQWAWWTGFDFGARGGWQLSHAGGGAGVDWTYLGPAVAPGGKPIP